MNSNTASNLVLGSTTLTRCRDDIRTVVGMLMSGLTREELMEVRRARVIAFGEWAIQIVENDTFEVWIGLDCPYRLFTAKHCTDEGALKDVRHSTCALIYLPFMHAELNVLADGMIARFSGVRHQVSPLMNAARYAEKLSAK